VGFSTNTLVFLLFLVNVETLFRERRHEVLSARSSLHELHAALSRTRSCRICAANP